MKHFYFLLFLPFVVSSQCEYGGKIAYEDMGDYTRLYFAQEPSNCGGGLGFGIPDSISVEWTLVCCEKNNFYKERFDRPVGDLLVSGSGKVWVTCNSVFWFPTHTTRSSVAPLWFMGNDDGDCFQEYTLVDTFAVDTTVIDTSTTLPPPPLVQNTYSVDGGKVYLSGQGRIRIIDWGILAPVLLEEFYGNKTYDLHQYGGNQYRVIIEFENPQQYIDNIIQL